MEFFRIRRDIPFMRHALVFNIISAVTFLAAVFFLATRGLHFSIEFTGGTVSEIHYVQTANLAHVREAVDKLGFGEVLVQNFGTSHDVMVRVPVRADVKQAEVAQRVFDALCAADQGTSADTWRAIDERISRGAPNTCEEVQGAGHTAYDLGGSGGWPAMMEAIAASPARGCSSAGTAVASGSKLNPPLPVRT